MLKRALYLTLSVLLAFVLVFSVGCKKKEEKEVTKAVKFFEDYDSAMGHFKKVYKAACVDEDISGVAEEASSAYEEWSSLAQNYKDSPPAKYADDKYWTDWLGKMEEAFRAIKEQTDAENVVAVEGACRNIQEYIFELNERTNNISAADEVSQFTVLIYKMEKALDEGDGDEAKRNFRMLKESQDRLYTSPYPESAKGRTEEFDGYKNQIYDLLTEFELAEEEERTEKMSALQEKAEEFYLEFGF